jgi:hypothetical protein
MGVNQVLILWAAFHTMTILRSGVLILEQGVLYAYLGVYALFMLTVLGLSKNEPVQWLRSFWMYACVVTIMCMHNFGGLYSNWIALVASWGVTMVIMSSLHQGD